MEDKEILNLILSKLDKMDARLDNMDARLDNMDARLDNMDARLDKMDARLDKMGARLDKVEAEQEEIKKVQMTVNIQLESIVDKCLQVLLEGYKMNAETFACFDANKIKQNTDYAVSIATIAYNTVMKQKAS